MSRENVELVRAFYAAQPENIAIVFDDTPDVHATLDALGAMLTSDFEAWTHGAEAVGLPEVAYGLEGFMEAWKDWLAPWASYRTEVDELVDYGDRVLVLAHEIVRPHGSDRAMRSNPVAAVWTIRDGRFARVDFWNDQEEAKRWVRSASR